VVFECVCRLLEKGYKPQHIELEPRWQVGHGASGGRADILIRDNHNKALLIIECKTWGIEFENAWKDTLNGKGQLFTYAHQERSTQYLCLYASGLENGALKYSSYIIAVRDNDDILKRKAAENPPTYRDSDSAKALYEAWKRTYESDYATRGIFEPDVQPYQIGKAKYTIADLQTVTEADIQPKYHQFATILRQHNVSGRENAFDKLVNLFLCKVVDEKHNPNDLQFYWRGIAFDTYFDLIDRLQRLYRDGMREFLKEDVTYIDNQTIRDAFKFFRNDPDATRDKILDYFKKQKYFTNNDFSFLDVHNEQLFYQNAAILLKIVRMLQDIRLNGDEQNQFLGDMFEFFLDQGFKQTEGQFFTPLPVTRFIVLSLPLETVFGNEQKPPKVIDYACGAGHFLTEMASQLRVLRAGQDVRTFYSQFYGIEKEYRLSKVAKVSAFMYNQDEINIVYADALGRHPDVPEGKFALLVSNPPYSVKGFLETLPEAERNRYALIETVDPKSYPTNNAIEAFFLERARQLLAPHGVAGIITPSSILSNAASVYTRVREILLQQFDIVALVELGSGTFGKTGTNTVTLFLRRKDDNPEPHLHYRYRVDSLFGDDEARKQAKTNLFSDAELLTAYCAHVGIPEDDYKTLLAGVPSDALLQTGMFREYRRAFDESSEVKALQKQKSFQQKSADEQKAELDKRFIDYVRAIEREKLYYFILAYTQPCPVLVVRSPQGTEEMKKFLGYEWSAAKGQEGIKYLHGSIDRIQTPLFDPQDRDNQEKISTLIRQNFMGQSVNVPASLQPYVTVARLVDLLDFSRVTFDKQILLNPKSSPHNTIVPISESVFTKYPIKKLGEIAKLFRGASPRPIESYLTDADDGMPWIKIGDVKSGDKFISQTAQRITAAGAEKSRRVSKGDFVISNSMSVGRPYILQIDGCVHDGWLILTNVDVNINKEYLYYVLASDYAQSQFQERALGGVVKNLNIERAKNVQIPVPPLDVQEQIVAECQAIDEEVERAERDIKKVEEEVESLFENSLNIAGTTYKLSDSLFDISIGKRVLEKDVNPDNLGIPVYSANVYEPFGFVDKPSPIDDFTTASVIWGIDGDWMVRYMPPNQPFYPTDHCGVIRVKHDHIIHARYLAWVLYRAGVSAGFSRHFRASIDRIKGLSIQVPVFDEQEKVANNVIVLEESLKQMQAVITSAPARRQAVLQKYLQSA